VLVIDGNRAFVFKANVGRNIVKKLLWSGSTDDLALADGPLGVVHVAIASNGPKIYVDNKTYAAVLDNALETRP
jgi:hypothetical protein